MSQCEDFPCCGHEAGDCDGSLYGTDEAIKEMARQHADCDHEAGHYPCQDGWDEDWECDDDCPPTCDCMTVDLAPEQVEEQVTNAGGL